MKPPRGNPLAGTIRVTEEKLRATRGLFKPRSRGRIRRDPRLADQPLPRHVEKARDLGVRVFDRDAQAAELGRYGISARPPRR